MITASHNPAEVRIAFLSAVSTPPNPRPHAGQWCQTRRPSWRDAGYILGIACYRFRKRAVTRCIHLNSGKFYSIQTNTTWGTSQNRVCARYTHVWPKARRSTPQRPCCCGREGHGRRGHYNAYPPLLGRYHQYHDSRVECDRVNGRVLPQAQQRI